jgi:hypothetical protein
LFWSFRFRFKVGIFEFLGVFWGFLEFLMILDFMVFRRFGEFVCDSFFSLGYIKAFKVIY